jgi:hypothetical protein
MPWKALYQPEGRGKIGRYFRSVREQFLANLDRQQTLSLEARVLFYIDKHGRMVLLHGFMKKTKQAMARELHTSRSQLDRLLDPQNVSVSLDTMARAAKVLGKSLVIRISDRKPGGAKYRGVPTRSKKPIAKRTLSRGVEVKR